MISRDRAIVEKYQKSRKDNNYNILRSRLFDLKETRRDTRRAHKAFACGAKTPIGPFRFAGLTGFGRRICLDAADRLEPRPRVDFGLRQYRRLRPEALDKRADEGADGS